MTANQPRAPRSWWGRGGSGAAEGPRGGAQPVAGSRIKSIGCIRAKGGHDTRSAPESFLASGYHCRTMHGHKFVRKFWALSHIGPRTGGWNDNVFDLAL